MERKAMQQLLTWKKNPNRLPLLIRGAGKVGKTWLMKELGKTEFDTCAYISLDHNRQMQALFSEGFDIDRILQGLSIESRVNISPENTLIILDEIQEVPEALQSLKYFTEDTRHRYFILAAGSLPKGSFPVGKVSQLNLYPLSFTEFLGATGNEALLSPLEERDFRMMNTLHSRYVDLLKLYFFTGGMPEAVLAYLQSRDLSDVREVGRELLSGCERDFSRHVPHALIPRIRMVWESIPSQLAKENKKFMYSLLRKGARARDFESAIWYLEGL